MKVSPISQNFLQQAFPVSTNVVDYSNYGVSFCGKNPIGKDIFVCAKRAMSAKQFRKLSNYMVDLYTAEPMLTQEQLTMMLDEKMFEGHVSTVVKKVRPYADKYLSGIEREVFTKIEKASQKTPNLTLPELFNSWYIDTRNDFRKIQKPYFDKIKRMSKKLPPEYLAKFKKFMKLTHNKLYDKPFLHEFNFKEFEYQVKKVLSKENDTKYKKQILTFLPLVDGEVLTSNGNAFDSKLMKKIYTLTKTDISQGKYVPDETLIKIKSIERIKSLANSKKNTALINLCEQSIQSLKSQPVKIPFSNRVFIYDLNKLLENLPDAELREKMLNVAKSLPQSNQNAEALILKYRNSDAKSIGYRLFSPSLVSIEHLVLASKGGSSYMSNCALAKMKYNNERSSEPLYITLQKYHPNAQQLYADKLVKLVKKCRVPKEDAIKQLQTIEREGHIKLHYEDLLTDL